MSLPFFSTRRAFTLIELLVVILIIAILVAVALPNFLSQQTKANDSAAQQVLATAYKEARLEFTGNGQKYKTAAELVTIFNASEPQWKFQEATATTGSITGSEQDPSGKKLISVYRVDPSSTNNEALPDNEIVLCTASQKERVFCIGSNQGQGWEAVNISASVNNGLFASPAYAIDAGKFERVWSRANSSKVGTIAILGGQGITAFPGYTAGGPVPVAPPKNDTAPIATGNTTVGNVIVGTDGQWTAAGAITYTYQWKACDASGENCTDIAGKTDKEITLTSSEVGKTIRFAVTASSAGVSATETSTATQMVAHRAPMNVVEPSISGARTTTGILNGDPGTWTADGDITYSYGWQLCGLGGSPCQTSGASTTTTLALSAGYEAQSVRFVVNATANGVTTTVVSASSGDITKAAPINVDAPSISDDATVSSTLTATTGMWSPTASSYAYQWQSCTDSSANNCSDLAGKTASTLDLTAAYIGKYIRVQVVATNSGGNSVPAYSSRSSVIVPAVVNTAFNSYGDTNGIFYYVGTSGKTQGFVNPVTNGAVVGSMSSTLGGFSGAAELTNRVNGSSVAHTTGETNGFFRWDFKNRTIRPSKFTIKQRVDSSLHNITGYVVEATNVAPSAGYVSSEWTTIGSGVAVPGAGTWSAINLSASTAYRYVQVRQTASDTSGYRYLVASEAEFYGQINE